MIVERGLNLGTPTKEKRREYANDQCSMVLCHSKLKQYWISSQISSIQNSEEALTRPLSPLVSWRALVEENAVRVILYSAESFKESFKSVGNISVAACDSLNQFSMLFQMLSSTYILTCESSLRRKYAKMYTKYGAL